MLNFWKYLSIFIITPAISHGEIITIDNDARILWFNNPNTVYFHGKYRRTYFAYISSDYSVKLAAYDHDLRKLEKETVNSFSKADDHNAPTLYVVQNGEKKGTIPDQNENWVLRHSKLSVTRL